MNRGGIETIGIAGAGTMGAGIAQVAARHGYRVTLYDLTVALVRAAESRIQGFWQRNVEKGRMSEDERIAAISRLSVTDDLEGLRGADLAIEAAPEDLDLKLRLLADLERICGDQALLATNTSSLSVNGLAAGLDRPERFAGMHFFNPAPLMALIEVVRAERSADGTLDNIEAVARTMGKTPVRTLDSPGFIVNRVARPFYAEALRMVGEGVSTPETVDAVLERSGFRMGPFTLMDLIGIDINLAVTRSVHAAFGGTARFRPHPLQEEKVEKGMLGRKSGEGFYRYDGGERQAASPDHRHPDVLALERRQPGEGDALRAAAAVVRAAVGSDPRQRVLLRILPMLVNEAAHALGEGVADRSDIDTAMCLGTNWPIGPLALGEAIGIVRVTEVLGRLGETLDESTYAPAPLLQELASRGEERFPA